MGQTYQHASLATVCPFVSYTKIKQSIYPEIIYKTRAQTKVVYEGPEIITYLLTPWSRVLLKKLTGSAASQEIPRIFGTRRFITVFISARHLSLSWANSIQSPQAPPTSWRSILIYTTKYEI